MSKELEQACEETEREVVQCQEKLATIKQNLTDYVLNRALSLLTKVIPELMESEANEAIDLIGQAQRIAKINSQQNPELDVHAQTAQVIFGVKANEVTQEMRKQAKVVNFRAANIKRTLNETETSFPTTLYGIPVSYNNLNSCVGKYIRFGDFLRGTLVKEKGVYYVIPSCGIDGKTQLTAEMCAKQPPIVLDL
jgi:hypothetical protein